MKLKSAFILLSLYACMVLAFVGLTSCGESATDGLEFELNPDGESYAVVSDGEAEDEESIIIPSTYEGKSVTKIAKYAIYRCDAKTIKIPSSITVIEEQAITFCNSLEEIVIENGVSAIETNAFMCNYALKSINIPASVTSIGVGILQSCGAVESITVDENNEVYDSRNGCNAIIETETGTLIEGSRTTVIPEDVTAIGDNAFYGRRNFTEINLPDGVERIGGNAFKECYELERITLGNSLVSIGDYAFHACEAMASIVLPDILETIGYAAFWQCDSLATVVMGTNVTYVGQIAFAQVAGGLTVNYKGTEAQWNAIDFDANSGFGYKIVNYNYEG